MKTVETIGKEILSSETEEVVRLLENLDKNSKVLARTYMAALVDRQKIEEEKLELVAV